MIIALSLCIVQPDTFIRFHNMRLQIQFVVYFYPQRLLGEDDDERRLLNETTDQLMRNLMMIRIQVSIVNNKAGSSKEMTPEI